MDVFLIALAIVSGLAAVALLASWLHDKAAVAADSAAGAGAVALLILAGALWLIAEGSQTLAREVPNVVVDSQHNNDGLAP